MHDFINIEFNGKTYTLVEELDEFGEEIIYHFVEDEDEKFCFKKDGKYIVIEDSKKINYIKEQLYFDIDGILFSSYFNDIKNKINQVMSECKILSRSKRKQFIEEQIDKLKGFEEFDEAVFRKKLARVNIFAIPKLMFNIQVCKAFYNCMFNSMFFQKNDVDLLNNDGKRTRLHETIHACTGPLKTDLLFKFGYRGLIEGAIENLVEKIYGTGKRVFFLPRCNYNLSPECAYQPLVSVIRQIEFITGKSSTDFALNGNTEIFKEFSNKYGKNLFLYTKTKSRRLANVELSKQDKEIILNELQNEILQVVWDKEFEEVNSMETAVQYIERLSQFESTRAFIPGDETFKQYYDKKMEQILELFGQQITPEEKSKFEQTFAYKGWIKSLKLNPEQIKSQRKTILQDGLFYNINASFRGDDIDEQAIFDFIKNCKMITKENGNVTDYFIVKDNQIISGCRIDNIFWNEVDMHYSEERLKRTLGKNPDEELSDDEISKAVQIERERLYQEIKDYESVSLEEKEIQELVKAFKESRQQKQELNEVASIQRTSQIKQKYQELKNLIQKKAKSIKLVLEDFFNGKIDR